MRALLCGCGQRLEADEDGRLRDQVVSHLKRDHLTPYIDYEEFGRWSRLAPIKWNMQWSTQTGPPRTRSSDRSLTELARSSLSAVNQDASQYSSRKRHLSKENHIYRSSWLRKR